MKCLMAVILLACACVVPRPISDSRLHLDLEGKIQYIAMVSTEKSTGTCFPIRQTLINKEKKYEVQFLTAKHIGGDKITIYFFNLRYPSKPEFTLTDVKRTREHATHDVAILTARTNRLLYIFKLQRKRPNFDDKVLSCGYGFGEPIITMDGRVLRPGRPGYWISSAGAVLGMSGGPLLDRDNHTVVGVISQLWIIPNGFQRIIVPQYLKFVPVYEIQEWALRRVA